MGFLSLETWWGWTQIWLTFVPPAPTPLSDELLLGDMQSRVQWEWAIFQINFGENEWTKTRKWDALVLHTTRLKIRKLLQEKASDAKAVKAKERCRWAEDECTTVELVSAKIFMEEKCYMYCIVVELINQIWNYKTLKHLCKTWPPNFCLYGK
jgi:hypothetical protein